MVPEDDERLATFATPRDWLRYAVGRFTAAGLSFGHGATNALDEAAFLILEALRLPIQSIDAYADARLLASERRRLLDLIEARVETRKPAAYLLNRAYIQNVPFYVDERVIVPRSFIGELLFTDLVGENAIYDAPDEIGAVLDLCTGAAPLAILAARVFPNAEIDAVDISADALAVARRNVAAHRLESRVRLYEGDLFAATPARRYDLILANPPYVADAVVSGFPPEYAAEPPIAHRGGADGLDIVRRILGEARQRLAPGGALVCEVGGGRKQLQFEFPRYGFLWLDTEDSRGEVFYISADDLKAGEEAEPGPSRRAGARPRPARSPRRR